MKYSDEERIEIVKHLVWDYHVKPEDILSMIDGRAADVVPFDRNRLFVRSLERLPWHRIVGLWGIELSEKMLCIENISKIRSRSRRAQLERLEKILRGEPLPPAEWNNELRKRLKNTVLSNRWYSTQQGLL